MVQTSSKYGEIEFKLNLTLKIKVNNNKNLKQGILHLW